MSNNPPNPDPPRSRQTRRADPFVFYQPPGTEARDAPRPASDAWLRSGAWIDGGVNPPQYYYSEEEKEATRRAHWPRVLALREADRQRQHPPPPQAQAPAPAPALPPVPPNQAHLPAAAPTVADLFDEFIDMPDLVEVSDSEEEGDDDDNVVEVPAPDHHRRASASTSATDNNLPVLSLPVDDGYLVNVVFHRKVYEKGPARSGSKLVERSKAVPQFTRIKLTAEWTRAQFFKALMEPHGLADRYIAGPISGPEFRLWWTGYSKSSAATIKNDNHFKVARDAILEKRGVCKIFVDIDASALRGFCVDEPTVDNSNVIPHGDDDELVAGTHVPQLNGFTDQQRLHGGIIQELQKLHKDCPDHKDEHGEAAICYRFGDVHIALNMRRLKIWAAAIAAGRATVFHPPEDDKENFPGPSGAKPRGRTGPRPGPSSEPAASAASSSMADIAPVLMTVVAKQAMDMMSGSSSRHRSCSPSTPRRSHRSRSRRRHGHHSSSPRRRRHHSSSPRSSPPPSSPIPAKSQELHACLVALRTQQDIDLLQYEDALSSEDYTPDVLSMVSVKDLCELTGAVKGRMLKLQRFAERWCITLEKKKRHRA